MLRRLALQGSQPPKLVIKIVEKATILALISYFGAFAYIYYATLPDVIENTRVSENAFLPGVVRPRFDKEASLSIFAKGLKNAFKNGNEKDYVLDALEQMGIEAYRQNYSLNVAYSIPKTRFDGQNVYGILRATKNPSVESMLLVVPFDVNRLEGAALALTMADYFKEQVYWARDIIFLFADPSPVAVEAWLSAFHGYPVSNLIRESLPKRSGTIVGVFIFDFAGQRFSNFEAKFFGVNGRQPNLDLINVIGKITGGYHMGGTTVQGLHYGQDSHEALIESLIRSIYGQTFQEIDGLHSVFGSYGISAVSLVGIPSTKKSAERVDLHHLAIIVESCFRSLNNILEKLHQSYFLYYLLSPKKFMSVAFYMPITGFFMVSMLFLALKEYFRRAGFSVPKALIYNHLLALGLYFGTVWIFSTNQIPKTVQTELQTASLIAGPIILSLLNFLYPVQSAAECVVLRFVFYVQVGLIIGATSLLSISPGIVIGIISVLPIIILTGILKTGSFLTRILSFLVHPLVLIYAGQFVLAYFKFDGYSHLLKHETPLYLAANWTMKALTSCVHKHILHSSMLFPLYSIFLLSISGNLISICRFNQDFLPNPVFVSREKQKVE
uniref:Glycosylphosphatidylinositol anchor attachment 1 protein n=2 Tax=Panagrolaimus sp. JU765 TaxID=591449 RepID=A0AC34QZR3_9BILA